MSTTEEFLSRPLGAERVPPVGLASGRSRAPMLVALDIDGTIVEENAMDVPPVTASAIQAVIRAGHHLVFATGRSLAGALPVVASAGVRSAWVAASEGAVVARLGPDLPGGYEVVDAFSVEVAQVVARAREVVPDVEIAAEVVGQGYHVTHVFPRGAINGPQAVRLAQNLPRSSPRLMLRTSRAAALVMPLRELGVTANLSGAELVNVTPPLLSKATALFRIRRRLGVDPDRTLAVGNGVNDLTMFSWAARSVAMGDAPELVRRAADATTAVLGSHGAAQILEAMVVKS